MSRVVLPADPRSASDARRLAHEILTEWDERDAADVVELLVSELVTNSVLHAGSAVDVSFQRRGSRLRVEVGDESAHSPTARQRDRTSTTGRGLELLEALAIDWGVQRREGAGKIIWFEVVGAHGEHSDEDHSPTATGSELPQSGNRIDVQLASTPARLFVAMEDHLRSLLREFALVALDTDAASWQAPTLPIDVNAVVDDLVASLQRGAAVVDIDIAVPSDATSIVTHVQHVLVEADRLAAAGLLLVAPPLPEIKDCRDWFLDEIARQLSGELPSPWRGAATSERWREPLHLDHRAVLEAVGYGVVVADDENHIAYANGTIETMLGWEPGGLAGQRLTVLIPDRLREAHVAGYSRYLLHQQPRILGERLRVAARKRDGTEIDIELLLGVSRSPTGQLMFVGTMFALDQVPMEETSAEGEDLLGSVVQLLAAPLDDVKAPLEQRAAPILEILAAHLDWQFAAWWTLNNERLQCLATWTDATGTYDRFVAATRRQEMQRGIGLPGRVWAAGQPVWMSDLIANVNFPRAAVALETGLRTGCGFPVIREGSLIAVVELFTTRALAPQASVIAGLTKVGQLLGVSVPV